MEGRRRTTPVLTSELTMMVNAGVQHAVAMVNEKDGGENTAIELFPLQYSVQPFSQIIG